MYAGFGSKRAVLEAVMDRRIVGDDESVALDDRAEVQATLADLDLGSRVSQHASITALPWIGCDRSSRSPQQSTLTLPS